MDFEEDIRAHVLSHLLRDAGVERELAMKNARELLIIYRNWLSRLISPRPRIVHRSSALIANPLARDSARKEALEEITRTIQSGGDLTPFLSRDIRHGYRSTQRLSPETFRRRKDLDLLLNDWQVHHLHLSMHMNADGFVDRTGPLLFAIFASDDAYLIDIIDHGGWFKEHVLKVIVREWPNTGLVEEIAAESLAVNDLSEKDRNALRNAGISAAFEVDGKYYHLTSALSTAGTSLHTMQAVIQVFRDISRFETALENDPNYVARLLAENGHRVPSAVDLHFAFLEDGGYGVVERNTNFCFRLKG